MKSIHHHLIEMNEPNTKRKKEILKFIYHKRIQINFTLSGIKRTSVKKNIDKFKFYPHTKRFFIFHVLYFFKTFSRFFDK